MYLVDPANQTILPFPAKLPHLDQQTKKTLTTPGALDSLLTQSWADSLHNSGQLKGLEESAPQSTLSMATRAAKAWHFNVLEHVMAAMTLLGEEGFYKDPNKAIYQVAVDPLPTTTPSEIFLWNLDFPTEDAFNEQPGAYYGPRFFAGLTLLVKRRADGKLTDLPREELPTIEFRKASSHNSKRRGQWAIAASVDGDGQLVCDEFPVYACVICDEQCAGDIRCLCGIHTYCTDGHRDGHSHCGNCEQCSETTTSRCVCGVPWYCSKGCQKACWKSHKKGCGKVH